MIESIVRLLKVNAASILIYNSAALNLEYLSGVGFHSDSTHAVVRLGDNLAGRVALTRQIVDVPELAKAELPLPFRQMVEREGFTSYRGIPVIAKGSVKGVLQLFHRSAFPSNPEWNDLLNLLAGQAAIAMDNAMLFNNLEQATTELQMAYDATIEGWSQAVELKDYETSGHTRRDGGNNDHIGAVKWESPDSELQISAAGCCCTISAKWARRIKSCSNPDRSMKRNGRLSVSTPQRRITCFLKSPTLRSALDIPYCHHEKWDGSGYPRSLKEEQIPLSARIFSVVDVCDALSYDRPYRLAWPKEKIIEYIKEQSAKRFDPLVVEAYLEII